MTASDTPAARRLSEFTPPTEWPAIERVAFRFVFVYFLLYGLPILLEYLPVGDSLANQWFLGMVAVGRWFILHVLHLSEHATPPFTDRLDLFLAGVLLVGVSIVMTLVWSVLDRRRATYGRLHVWLEGFVRIVLALEMFSYGWSKLLPYQFWGGQVPLYDLARPLGQLDPQRLLWALMGFSRPYAIFAGAMECVGALFLCFRRTATLGGVILLGTLANVVMLNFAYDVPVKWHSINLLLMALFVIAPDIGRLSRVLLFNEATAPREAVPLFRSPHFRRITVVGAPALAVLLAFLPLPSMLPDLRTAGRGAPPPPLYGIFDVDSTARQGVVLPSVLTDTTLWRRVVFDRGSRASLTTMTDSVQLYQTVVDTVGRTVQLVTIHRNARIRINGRADTLRFSFARPDASHLELRGVVAGKRHIIWLRHTPVSTYRLINAEHRWAW